MTIKKIWRSISEIGVKPSLSNKLKNQIILLNQLAFISFIASTANSIVVLIQNTFKFPNNLILPILAAAIFAFNYYGKYQVSKFLIGYIFPLMIGFLMITVGNNFSLFNVLLVCMVVVFILYEGEGIKLLVSLFTIALVVFTVMVYRFSFQSISDLYINPFNGFIAYLTSFIALATIVAVYQKNILSAISIQVNLASALKEKNLDLERFAYVTSHDLKEPVRNIENLSKFVNQNLEDPKYKERNKKMIGMIKESSKRMSDLIDSILKYSKLDAKELPFERIDLEAVINDFHASHVEVINDDTKKLVYDSLPLVYGNRTFISLLFQNLIENSFKYNNSKEKIVSIRSTYKNDHYEISITDNGIGINQDFREYIFEPFKRLHSNQSFNGSGLGLSICKKIVELHHGKIWVEVNPEGGSIFNFTLPASEFNANESNMDARIISKNLV